MLKYHNQRNPKQRRKICKGCGRVYYGYYCDFCTKEAEKKIDFEWWVNEKLIDRQTFLKEYERSDKNE